MGFTKYTEYTPVKRPDHQKDAERVAQGIERETRSSVEREGLGRAVRVAHGKSYGLARATVTVGELSAEYAQGIFAEPRSYDAVIRHSNALSHIRPDAELGTACGLGIKMFGVPGASLLGDEADATTFDLNLMNNPTFFANTAHDYMASAQLFTGMPHVLGSPDPRNKLLADFLTRQGTLASPERWLWDELISFLSFAAIPWKNLLAYTYYSVGAFRYGQYIAKMRTVPTPESAHAIVHSEIDTGTDAEAFRHTLVAELAERDHGFELQVQLNTDLDRMPVDNTSVQWPEQLSPWTTVAGITIPRQDISGEENQTIADGTSITPWRTREEHRPIGEIQRLREEAYRRSSIERHRINHQPRHEPTSSRELLG